MINHTVTEDILYDWVLEASGIGADNIVWGYQNHKKPHSPYMALDILMRDQHLMADDPSYLPDLDTGSSMVCIEAMRGLTFSVKCFEDYSYLQKLDLSLSNPLIREIFRKTHKLNLKIDTVGVGDYILYLYGIQFKYTSTGADTAETIKNGLKALINASTWLSSQDVVAADGLTTSEMVISGPVGLEVPITNEDVKMTLTVSQYPVDMGIMTSIAANKMPVEYGPGWVDMYTMDFRFTQRKQLYIGNISSISTIDVNAAIDNVEFDLTVEK